MPNVDAPITMTQLLTLFEKMMEKNTEQTKEMIATIVSEIRKPPVDPVKEIAAKRAKASKDAAEKEFWAKKEALKKNCTHLRQNGSCNIAWATQSDGIERGVCPYCGSTFDPSDGELYTKLRGMHRGMIESVRYVA